jgi:hypothetical protein
MSKKKPKYEAPLNIEATLDITEEGHQCLIDVTCIDGHELSPQIILDAVADMLTAHFEMVPEDWDFPEEGLDS